MIKYEFILLSVCLSVFLSLFPPHVFGLVGFPRLRYTRSFLVPLYHSLLCSASIYYEDASLCI